MGDETTISKETITPYEKTCAESPFYLMQENLKGVIRYFLSELHIF
jgi:hypothetical protein